MNNELVTEYFNKLMCCLENDWFSDTDSIAEMKTDIVKTLFEALDIETYSEESIAAMVMFFEKIDKTAAGITQNEFGQRVCMLSRNLGIENNYCECDKSCNNCPAACVANMIKKVVFWN